jgi:hypothetical protein
VLHVLLERPPAPPLDGQPPIALTVVDVSASAGLLLPIVHERKTELQSILRVGYMRWFNTGESGGSPGMLFSWEARWL